VESFAGVESMFGTKTSAFLTRTTTIMSVVFFLTCLSLAVLSVRQSKSLMGNVRPRSLSKQAAARAEAGKPGTLKMEAVKAGEAKVGTVKVEPAKTDTKAEAVKVEAPKAETVKVEPVKAAAPLEKAQAEAEKAK